MNIIIEELENEEVEDETNLTNNLEVLQNFLNLATEVMAYSSSTHVNIFVT